MSDGKVHGDSSNVDNAANEVMVSGPDGVAVSMTPEAALETGRKLIEHAEQAINKRNGSEEDEQDPAEDHE